MNKFYKIYTKLGKELGSFERPPEDFRIFVDLVSGLEYMFVSIQHCWTKTQSKGVDDTVRDQSMLTDRVCLW